VALDSHANPMLADVATSVEDAQGRLWFASSTGLWVKMPGVDKLRVIQRNTKRPDSLASDNVMGLLVDSTDQLWVMTNKGLDRLKSWDGHNAVFEHVSAGWNKSLENASANLLQDQLGRIWVGTVLVFDPKTLVPIYSPLPVLGHPVRDAYTRTRDGLFLLGGTQGLTILDPAKFKAPDFHPPMRATTLKINGKPVPTGILASNLTLESNQRSFSIEFSSLDFSSPKDSRYAYRLQGYDPEWIETDWEHRSATYSNLWPGRYTLQVRGGHRMREWSNQPLSIPIEILPAFWQTKWFAALVLLSLVGSAWFAWRWRITHHHQQAKAQAQELQTLVDVRTAEALSAHNQLALVRQLEQTRSQMLQQEKMAALGMLTAGVAHEINNPTNFTHVAAQIQRTNLTEFQHFLMDLLDEEAESKVVAEFTRRFTQLQDNVSTMLEGTERIKTIVNDLRAFSRRELAEKKSVHISECLISTLNLVRTNWGSQVEFITEFTDDPFYECWPTLLNQVFMNLMVNGCHAIATRQQQDEHPSDVGHMWLRLRLQGDRLTIEIEDDGCGIDPEVRERILEPFFTTKDIDTGTGLGLSIAHGIIQKHFGTLEITSTPGQGSCFAVHLPWREESQG
jgi:signal transduction histidine kinase